MEGDSTQHGASKTQAGQEKRIEDQVDYLLKLIEAKVEQKSKELQSNNHPVREDDVPKKGKPLNGFLEFTSYFSGQASAVNRSLSLAGIAIIWLFKKPENEPIIKGLLNVPLLLLAVSLALDLIQYFFGALAWNFFYEYKYRRWKKINFDQKYAKDIEAPNYISIPISIIFILKIVATGIAFYYILSYLLNNI